MEDLIQSQQKLYLSQQTKSYHFRYYQLEKLRNTIIHYQEEISSALHKDLHKSPFEAYATEIGYILKSIRFTQKRLKKWMKTKKVKTPFSVTDNIPYST